MLRQPLIDTHGAGQKAGERLKQLSKAGLPHCVKAVDDAGWALEAIKAGEKYSVSHTIIFRQTAPGRQANDHPNLSLPAEDAAVELWQAVKATMPPELLPYKHKFYVEPTNEIDTPENDPAKMAWVGRFCAELATLILEDGYNPALAGFNSGQPSEDQIVQHFAEMLQLFDRFPSRCLVTYHEAKLKLEVGEGENKRIIDHHSPLSKFDGWLVNVAGKWKRAAERLGTKPPKLFISESTWAYDELCESSQFRQECQQLAQMDAQHGNVVGRVIWTATRGDQWGDLRGQLNSHADWLTDYILNTRIATEEEGGGSRGEPREQYKRTVILLPPNAGTDWAIAAVGATWGRARWTVLGSADDAGIGDLDYRRVIAVNPQAWGGNLKEWYELHYPGIVYEPVVAQTAQNLAEKLAFFAENDRWPELTVGFQIHDIVNELPKHPTKEYKSRPLESITHLVVHHTVSPPDRSIASIAEYHVNSNGWPGIGYHFVVRANGEIYQTNQLRTISHHTANQNSYSIGIALQGDFTAKPPPAKQLEAAKWLIGWLKQELPKVKAIQPHRGMPGQATACPGETWEQWFWKVAGEEPPPAKEDEKPKAYYGPPVAFVAGVDGPASDWYWPKAKKVFEVTGLAVKFHTAGTNYHWYSSYKNSKFNPVRIVLSHTFAATSSASFFLAFKNDVVQFYRQGARDFIVLNECNIEHVGSWRNGFEFGKLFRELCQLIKREFPGVRLWFPGTSPQYGAQHQFISDAKRAGAFDEVYGIVEHVYTVNTSSADAAAEEMLAEVKEFQQRWALDRPLVIGEFAVVAAAQPGYKAQVYRLFYEKVAQLPGIAGAYSFTSSWHPSADERGEGWLEMGIHKAYMAQE